ncbi:MAG: DUF2170 family protein [Gammaproteobacteria bacterium]|nr:DUF2170 family protein [Gammaproteobacteria bacterium]
MSNDALANFAAELDGHLTEEGMKLSANMRDHDGAHVIQVEIEDREEFPIFISLDSEQLLCTCYLWHDNEVNNERRCDMLDAMTTLNLPMPLSSFGKVGDQYLIFGAMSAKPTLDDLIHEICVLSDNSLNAIETLQDYLN